MAIVTLTLNPTLDKTTHVDGILADHKLRCSDPTIEPGGGGVNVSRAIKNLGGESLAILLEGGANGELFCELLTKENVPFIAVQTACNTRDNFMIHDDRNDKQFRFGFPGGPIQPSEENEALRIVLDNVQKGDYLVASGSLPNGASPDFYSTLGKLLKERGVKFVLDTSRDALINGLAGGTYMMKPNWREISELTGVQDIKPSEQEELVSRLVKRGSAEVVIASMGSQGAMIVTKDKVDYVKAAKVKMKSTVGAGDSMLAAIVYKLSQGWDLKEAAMYGTAAGSSASAQPGTQLCTLDHTESLFAHIKQRSK